MKYKSLTKKINGNGERGGGPRKGKGREKQQHQILLLNMLQYKISLSNCCTDSSETELG